MSPCPCIQQVTKINALCQQKFWSCNTQTIKETIVGLTTYNPTGQTDQLRAKYKKKGNSPDYNREEKMARSMYTTQQ